MKTTGEEPDSPVPDETGSTGPEAMTDPETVLQAAARDRARAGG